MHMQNIYLDNLKQFKIEEGEVKKRASTFVNALFIIDYFLFFSRCESALPAADFAALL